MSKPVEGKFHIVFLFVDEIRAASAALDSFIEINNEDPATRDEGEWSRRIRNALMACQTAFQGASDKSQKLVLCEKDWFAAPTKEPPDA